MCFIQDDIIAMTSSIIIIIIIITIIIITRKEKNYSFKTLFTIPVDFKSTQLSLERVN